MKDEGCGLSYEDRHYLEDWEPEPWWKIYEAELVIFIAPFIILFILLLIGGVIKYDRPSLCRR